MFSSLMLFTPESKQISRRPWGPIHLPPIFFLQLLLLTLLILALAEPVFSVRPTSIAIVMDNSASMQALENGKTRMALAQEKAGTLTEELGPGGKVDIYTTTPRLEKMSRAPLTPVEAKSLVAKLKALDLGEPPTDYSRTLGTLAHDGKYQRVYLVTDHPARGQSSVIRIVSVGEPKPNLAVTAFEVNRSSLVNTRLEARATVSNFSNQSEKVKLALKGDGAILATRELSVAAGGNGTASFEGFPLYPFYELAIDQPDALPLDNRRFAVAPPSRNLRILAVTPRPEGFASLKAIPGISIDVISPAEYEKSSRGDYGLEIFHFAAPGVLPENPAVFILPPGNSSMVALGAPIVNVQVSGWREPHELTRYINFSLFRPAYARPLKPKTAGDIIIDSPNGALAFAIERHGVRYLALGFDPFPYLGSKNLPMSIFTLNFLDWFFEGSAVRAQATGEPLAFGTIQPGDFVITPGGDKVPLAPGSDRFFETFQQGIYQWHHGADSRLYVRNLTDSSESDLRNSTPIEVRDTVNTPAASSALFDLWPYLLLASLLLFFLEWFVTPRAIGFGFHRRSMQAASHQ